MRYEIVNGEQIPKIGFGTWRIGGHSFSDPSSDVESMQALRSALALGYTHFDTAEAYATGHAEELLGRVIRESGVPRDRLFITSKVSPEHLHYQSVLQSCEYSLRRLGMDYLDLYLIHWPGNGIPLEETFRALNQLVGQGKVRHLGVSNFNLTLLQKAAALSATPLFTNQVSYSVPDRTCVINGVLDACQRQGILITAYSPVKRRNIKSNPVLKTITQARSLTPEQVALAWLINQPGVITIPMSKNPQHQAENFQAADIILSLDEMNFLTHHWSEK